MLESNIRNALSRSLGIAIEEDSENWCGYTSRSVGERGSFRQDVFHLFVPLTDSQPYWKDNLQYELRKAGVESFGFFPADSPQCSLEIYRDHCERLSPELLKTIDPSVRFESVVLTMDPHYEIHILLRDH